MPFAATLVVHMNNSVSRKDICPGPIFNFRYQLFLRIQTVKIFVKFMETILVVLRSQRVWSDFVLNWSNGETLFAIVEIPSKTIKHR